MLKPCYCENIIVGVIQNRKFNWYVTHKDLWKLDYVKLYDNIKKQYEMMSFSQKKFEYDVGSLEYFCGNRWGIAVLDKKNSEFFLKKIEDCMIDVNTLREMYLKAGQDQFEYLPVLYVDFDKKILYSYFPEPETFENFVPNNWVSEYKNFYKFIPKHMIYWDELT